MSLLSVERLREVLRYDAATGVFTWRVARNNRNPIGAVAGNSPGRGGYTRIRIDRRAHSAHRLAWLYVTGEWPSGEIDHKDGNPSNNAISNLRQASRAQNEWNKDAPRTNTSGVKGVNWNRAERKWHAKIMVGGRRLHLGLFANLADAAVAYRRAADENFGQFVRGECAL
jgi:hypothetical protein